MNWIDTVIAAPLLMGLYRGYRMGLIRQLASIVTWIFGFYGAVRFSALVSTQLRSRVGEKDLAVVSFVVAFLLIAIIVYLLRKSMEWGFRVVWMYRLNRILGACFGLLKSLLYVSVSVFFFSQVNNNLGVVSPQLLEESVFFGKVAALNASFYDKVSQWFQDLKGIPF